MLLYKDSVIFKCSICVMIFFCVCYFSINPGLDIVLSFISLMSYSCVKDSIHFQGFPGIREKQKNNRN